MQEQLKGLTLGEAIRYIMPEGCSPSYEKDGDNQDDKPNWTSPPRIPFDMFAVCGYLINQSGMMGLFDPDPNTEKAFEPSDYLKISLSDSERKSCESIGKKWSEEFPNVPVEVDSRWSKLCKAYTQPIRCTAFQVLHRNGGEKAVCPTWWEALVQLFIIADEASSKVGFIDFSEPKLMPIHQFVGAGFRAARAQDIPTEIDDVGDATSAVIAGTPASSYASAVIRELVCVQPKGRVSQLGHSLRNLSKNLSLTGPVGGVRCKWHQLETSPLMEEDEGLDILLVPLPYDLPAKLFKSRGNHKTPKDSQGLNPGWGNFKVQQSWLEGEDGDAIVPLVERLVKKAQEDVEHVNAVIFPEYALNFQTFQKVCAAVNKIEPKIEFIVAGSSDNCEGQGCNCVFTAVWEKTNGKDDGLQTFFRITSQRKHHRWRLERNQLRTYGLAGRLTPEKFWWENHDAGQRELNFYQFRRNSAFTSLVCEDLARNDPVHDVIRSVGPNLLFALLMDGAQLPYRWSARYASALADDPGTSVLTLTSFGLIKRANDNGAAQPSNAVGFWKDDSGDAREINLPAGAKGVLLSLSAVKNSEFTIDGRCCDDSNTWRFNSQKPLYVDEDTSV